MAYNRPGTPDSAVEGFSPIRGDHNQLSPITFNRPSLNSETFQSPTGNGIDDISVNLSGAEDDFETNVARLPSPNNGAETDNDVGWSTSPRLDSNFKATGLDDEISGIKPFGTSPPISPPAGNLKTTGLDDESASVESKGSGLLDEAETSIPSSRSWTVDLPPDPIIKSAMHILVEERPYYRGRINDDLRDSAIKLIRAIMEHDRAQEILQWQETDRSHIAPPCMDHGVLLETIRWTIKDGYAITLPYFDSTSLEVRDNTTDVGLAMSTQKMATPTLDVQSKTTKEYRKDVRKVKKRDNYKCKRCGRPKKNHVCSYDAAANRTELENSKGGKFDDKNGNNDGKEEGSKRYLMMLDAWTDQGYIIRSETGKDAVIETTEINWEETQGAIAAEILRGIQESQERIIVVSAGAVAAIDEEEPVSSKKMENVSASDLESQEETELYVSAQGLQRILEEQTRQKAVEDELARLEQTASIDPRATTELRLDGLIDSIQPPTLNQGLHVDDPRNNRTATSDEELAAFLEASLNDVASEGEGKPKEEV